jgi:hypothetical protein
LLKGGGVAKVEAAVILPEAAAHFTAGEIGLERNTCRGSVGVQQPRDIRLTLRTILATKIPKNFAAS